MDARDERGAVLPTRLLAMSVSVIVAGAATYALTQPHRAQPAAVIVGHPQHHLTAPALSPKPAPKHRRPKVIRRDVNVSVFNNTTISHLAADTAARAGALGWKVVGSENWYGTVPATTVYFPPRLKAAAHLLGKDLGIGRIKPSIAPMQPGVLTLILTGPLPQ